MSGLRPVELLLVFCALGCAADGPGLVSDNPAIHRMQKPEAGVQRTTFEAAVNPFPGVTEGHIAVQIRAQVNGIAILDDEVRAACYPALVETLSMPEPERSQQQALIFRRQLQDIIEREVLLQDAFAKLQKTGPQYLEKLKAAAGKEFDKELRAMKRRAGAKTDEELIEMMRKSGLNVEAIRRQIERNFMAREYLRNRIFSSVERIGHQQIVEYYRDHPKEFEAVDRVTWQHLFIDVSKFPSREAARQFAEQLAQRAQSGEDFGRLLQYDNGDSSYRQGAGIGQLRGEIRPLEAESILFGLRDGQVGPVLELPTGYHILKLVKREFAGQMVLDEKLQSEIKKKLQIQVFERETKQLVAELRAKCTIEIAGTNP